MAMFWRKDWLDKLNLEVPETLEEYEKVLTAFVENDPDGNGKEDIAGMDVAYTHFRAQEGAEHLGWGVRLEKNNLEIPPFTVWSFNVDK